MLSDPSTRVCPFHTRTNILEADPSRSATPPSSAMSRASVNRQSTLSLCRAIRSEWFSWKEARTTILKAGSSEAAMAALCEIYDVPVSTIRSAVSNMSSHASDNPPKFLDDQTISKYILDRARSVPCNSVSSHGATRTNVAQYSARAILKIVAEVMSDDKWYTCEHELKLTRTQRTKAEITTLRISLLEAQSASKRERSKRKRVESEMHEVKRDKRKVAKDREWYRDERDRYRRDCHRAKDEVFSLRTEVLKLQKTNRRLLEEQATSESGSVSNGGSGSDSDSDSNHCDNDDARDNDHDRSDNSVSDSE